MILLSGPRAGGGRGLVTVIIALAVWVALPFPAQAELVDRVIAAVNNDVISLSELRQAVAFNTALGERGNGRRIAAETLDGLINRKLLLLEAYRLRFVEVSEKEISAEIDLLRRQFGSDGKYRSFLSRAGMTEEQLGRMIGERLLVERFVERKIELYTRVTRDDAQAYYDDHPDEFRDRRFSEVQKQITALLSHQMVEQQLDSYIAELRGRADIRINPLREEDGF